MSQLPVCIFIMGAWEEGVEVVTAHAPSPHFRIIALALLLSLVSFICCTDKTIYKNVEVQQELVKLP